MASYGYTFNSGDGVTPTRLNSARTVSEIVNADIKSDAAIAGTKIAPDFGSQSVVAVDLTSRANNASAAVYADRASTDGGPPYVVFDKSRGTQSSKTAVQNADQCGQLLFRGYDGANSVAAAAIACYVDGTPGTNDMPGRLSFWTTADGGSSATERMRIDSAGNINFGTAAPVDVTSGTEDGGSFSTANNLLSLSRNGSAALRIRRRTSNGEVVTFHRDTTQVGNISVTTTATAYNTSSDYRLKENATPLTGGLALIEQVRPVEFDWKGHNEKGRGFIAHELQAVVPEAVTGEKDAVDAGGNPEYQGVDASKIVPLLVAAVQELSAKVAAMEAAQ